MKKWIFTLCITILTVTLLGCGQSENLSLDETTTEKEAVETLLLEKLSGEITVSCYDTMFYKNSLELAAKDFEAKNPGTKINIETFASMPVMKTLENGLVVSTRDNEEQERIAYINKTNTELMSGRGADLIAMDVLPYTKYADANQIEDLAVYMDKDPEFDRSNFQSNIMDAVKYHDGQYLIPLDYTFNYIAYDKSLFTKDEQQQLSHNNNYTFDQLVTEAIIPFNRINANREEFIKMFPMDASSQTLISLFRIDYDSFIDIENKQVNLTDGRFTDLLKSVKTYEYQNYLKPNPKSSDFTMEDFEKTQQEQFFYKIKSSISLLTDNIRHVGLDHSQSFNIFLGDETNDEILGLLSNAKGQQNFNYTQAFSINSNSENKALAWAFLKYLMSEENQLNQNSFSSGLSINNSARLEKARLDLLKLTSDDDPIDLNKPFTEVQQKAYDLYLQSLETFSDDLNHIAIQDDNIEIMIINEISDYFSGSRTAEEVSNTLQSKIELYLNE